MIKPNREYLKKKFKPARRRMKTNHENLHNEAKEEFGKSNQKKKLKTAEKNESRDFDEVKNCSMINLAVSKSKSL